MIDRKNGGREEGCVRRVLSGSCGWSKLVFFIFLIVSRLFYRRLRSMIEFGFGFTEFIG